MSSPLTTGRAMSDTTLLPEIIVKTSATKIPNTARSELSFKCAAVKSVGTIYVAGLKIFLKKAPTPDSLRFVNSCSRIREATISRQAAALQFGKSR